MLWTGANAPCTMLVLLLKPGEGKPFREQRKDFQRDSDFPRGGGTNALPKSVWALTFKLHRAVFPTELPGNAPTAHHPISPSQLALLSLEEAV